MKLIIELGEFRNRKDEQPITLQETKRHYQHSIQMHKDVDYNKLIPYLEAKLKSAKPKDKQNLQSLIMTAKTQQLAGFGKQ